MKQKTKTKGISLIVLVITIIIIIILAGAVILSLSNSNVINKAKSGIMQTDMATVKEQIKTKMAENELNNINTKIGTQLWDSYYTMSVSQLQEIGITTKSDYIYDYNTGNLSVKQNNEYVTSEELYPTDPQGAYIEGYLGLNFITKSTEVEFIDEEVTDSKITSATDSTIKAALQKQQLAQKYTNGGIKVKLVSKLADDFLDIYLDETLFNTFESSLLKPIYETRTNNSGYFRLENITPGSYTLVITNDINTLPLVRNITVTANQAKVISTKASRLKLITGKVSSDQDRYAIGGDDIMKFYSANNTNSTDIIKYDINKDGKVSDIDLDLVYGNMADYTVYDMITI